jgi:lipopolysaccharide transport system permease protein
MYSRLPVKTYTPQNTNGFLYLLKEGFSNIVQSNFLALQLAKRDISAQYRQSLLGLFWGFVLPLTTAVLWIFLKGSGTVALQDTGIAYPIYVFIGTMAWSILTESILGPITGTLTMRSTLSKINFPKEALIASSLYKTLFNTLIKLLALIVFIIVFNQKIGFYIILFPVALFVLALFGTAFGLLITPAGLLYGDVSKLIIPVMQVLMYLSPVVFAMPNKSTGIYNSVVNLNPLSNLIINFRNTLIGLPMYEINYFLIISAVSVIVFLLSLVYFKITIPIITERIGG